MFVTTQSKLCADSVVSLKSKKQVESAVSLVHVLSKLNKFVLICRKRSSNVTGALGVTVGRACPLSGLTVTWNCTPDCEEALTVPPPALPERERLVNRPTTAEGLITNATPLPLDTFMVVLSAVFVVPPPSVPPISVHDSVSALKLKLPLLWAKLSPDPNVTIRIDVTKNDTKRFICILLDAKLVVLRFSWHFVHGSPRWLLSFRMSADESG